MIFVLFVLLDSSAALGVHLSLVHESQTRRPDAAEAATVRATAAQRR